jgi:hypothetical protein
VSQRRHAFRWSKRSANGDCAGRPARIIGLRPPSRECRDNSGGETPGPTVCHHDLEVGEGPSKRIKPESQGVLLSARDSSRCPAAVVSMRESPFGGKLPRVSP